MLKSLIKKTSVAIPAFALTLMGVTALAGGRGEVQSYESTRSARTIERSVPDSTVAISAEPATLEELLASRTQGARWLKSVQKSDGGWGAGAWGTDDPSAPSDVATTSLIVLALTRDAKGTGVHDKSIRRAVRYVTQVVESSPSTRSRLSAARARVTTASRDRTRTSDSGKGTATNPVP